MSAADRALRSAERLGNSGLPAIPPITVFLLREKTCWGCGGRAAVSIRVLTARHHRFYCHACAKAA